VGTWLYFPTMGKWYNGQLAIDMKEENPTAQIDETYRMTLSIVLFKIICSYHNLFYLIIHQQYFSLLLPKKQYYSLL
jgi:hypothetical protein